MDLFPVVKKALVDGDESVEFKDFMIEELDNIYCTVDELKKDIDNVVVKKKKFSNSKPDFADKIINFIYSSLTEFVVTDKIKGIPMSKNFIDNIKCIMRNKTYLHHSHISREIVG